MDDVLKVAAVAVAGAICAVVVKKSAQEVGIILALTAGVVILSAAMGAVEGVRGLMDDLAQTAGLSPAVLAPVIKTVGIALITRVAAEVCRDAKESGIAAFVEVSGAAMALFVAVPLLRAVLDTIIGLL
jgi:stage III sporulation protein AD